MLGELHQTLAVDLSQAFVQQVAGTVSLQSSVISQVPRYTPATAPQLTAVGKADSVKLIWDAIPGATSYEIFTTPTDLTPFASTPVESVDASTTTVTLTATAGISAWYAVSAVVDGVNQMDAPMVSVTATYPESQNQNVIVSFGDSVAAGEGDPVPLGAEPGLAYTGYVTKTVDGIQEEGWADSYDAYPSVLAVVPVPSMAIYQIA